VFTRFIGRLANAVPIDPERGAISSLAFGAVLLKRKLSIVWFPEGGLSRTESFSHSSRESVSCLRVSLSRSYRCSSREHTRPCQSALSCLVSGKSGSPSESRLIRGSWSARARENQAHERIVNALRETHGRLKEEVG